jgi:hypothetical protein
MMSVRKSRVLFCVVAAALAAPAVAVAPIDGEVSAVWWANAQETSSSSASTSSDAGAPGLRAEMWMLERYGMRASQYAAEPDAGSGSDFTSLDVMWRAMAPTENNYVALGLGWEQMELAGFRDATSGVRVSVQGSMGLLDMLQAYGAGSYLPALDDAVASDPLDGSYEDVDAFEYELGLAWKAMPFMNVHAGYRVNSVSYTRRTDQISGSPGGFAPASGGGGVSAFTPGSGAACSGCASSAVGLGEAGETETSGFFVGLGFSF